MSGDEHLAPGDEAPLGDAPAGDVPCERCHGSGRVDGEACPECEGSGVVTKGVGGA
jgi:RecJ-like exonuclease